MVTVGKRGPSDGGRMKAMGPERSRLHNFTLPPCLKWGNPRLLRCMKQNPNGEVPSAAGAADRRSPALVAEKELIRKRKGTELEWRGSAHRTESFKKSPSPAAGVGVSGWKSSADNDRHEGIEAFGAKLMFDLQTEADKLKVAILQEGLEEGQPPAPAARMEADSSRPWNLRTRRAACKAPNETNDVISLGGGGGGGNANGGGKSLKDDERRPSFSPSTTQIKSPTREKKERAKFSVSLSRREIEEDFMAMVGHRPPRRPKKRPKIVQNELNTLFPGLWLTEVTADMYKIPETAENGKR